MLDMRTKIPYSTAPPSPPIESDTNTRREKRTTEAAYFLPELRTHAKKATCGKRQKPQISGQGGREISMLWRCRQRYERDEYGDERTFRAFMSVL